MAANSRRTSRFTPARAARRRRGISLLEVLISMFVLLIGLLGVASLITAGGFHLGEATKIERAEAIGRSAFREVKIRGMLQPEVSTATGPVGTWITAAGTAYPTLAGVPHPDPDNNSVWGPVFSFAIDPLGMAVNAGANNITYFPAQQTGDPAGYDWHRMVRVTLPALRGMLGPMLIPQADDIFRSQDDLTFQIPTNTEQLPIQQFMSNSAGARTKRMSDGEYSWLLTASPNSLDSRAPYTVSVVVFHKRVPLLTADLPPERPVPAERMVSIAFPTVPNPATDAFPGAGIGGGDVVLRTPSTNHSTYLDVKGGQWILLSQQSPAPNPPTAGSAPTFQFRWYRVIAADETQQIGNDWVRVVTLHGPDLNPNLPTTAALFDGVIAVYEKTMHLEGPSPWSY